MRGIPSSTEYSRVILALSSIGKDPANVGGFNLLNLLTDFTINDLFIAGYTLMALDCNNYELSIDNSNIMRELIVYYILREQLLLNDEHGGWSSWILYPILIQQRWFCRLWHHIKIDPM